MFFQLSPVRRKSFFLKNRFTALKDEKNVANENLWCAHERLLGCRATCRSQPCCRRFVVGSALTSPTDSLSHTHTSACIHADRHTWTHEYTHRSFDRKSPGMLCILAPLKSACHCLYTCASLCVPHVLMPVSSLAIIRQSFGHSSKYCGHPGSRHRPVQGM